MSAVFPPLCRTRPGVGVGCPMLSPCKAPGDESLGLQPSCRWQGGARDAAQGASRSPGGAGPGVLQGAVLPAGGALPGAVLLSGPIRGARIAWRLVATAGLPHRGGLSGAPADYTAAPVPAAALRPGPVELRFLQLRFGALRTVL